MPVAAVGCMLLIVAAASMVLPGQSQRGERAGELAGVMAHPLIRRRSRGVRPSRPC